jgi:hypothetical protein
MNLKFLKIKLTLILSITFCIISTFKIIFYNAIGMVQSIESIMFHYIVSVFLAVLFILYFTALVKLIKPEKIKKVIPESRCLKKC